ncbi:MAG: sugar ABC transporter permease [Spirochaetia bacterium]|nr:sugar ABC transporter permease [Spirochaetia bacterium]MCF7941791.1 sugar ABC transporter permease [Spirochaetia bacterium]
MSQHRLERSEQKLAMLLLIPSFLVIFLIAFYPLGSVFVTSFTNRTFASSVETETVGFDNYRKLLSLKIMKLEPIFDPDTGLQAIDDFSGEPAYQDPIDLLPRDPFRYKPLREFDLFGTRYVYAATDPKFIQSIEDTLFFTLTSVILETIFGMMIALIMIKNFPGRGGLRVAMLVPWAIPTAVSSRMWEWMFASTRVGVFNVIAQWMGYTDGQFPFLTDASTQIWAMIAIDVWKTTPFMALLLMAGLQTIPMEVYEAAYIDGCGAIRRFTKITMPLVKHTLLVALVFRTLDALRVFDLFQIVFAQKRYSMASFSYYQLIDNKMMGYSSAASVVIFFIILFFILLYTKISGGIQND